MTISLSKKLKCFTSLAEPQRTPNNTFKPSLKINPLQFPSINEILQHLAVIYVNPNKVQDAKYEYNHLIIKPCQSFAEF